MADCGHCMRTRESTSWSIRHFTNNYAAICIKDTGSVAKVIDYKRYGSREYFLR